jgi:hypothetical protein
MFKSITWDYNPNRYVNGGKTIMITIIDTDFTETTIANNLWEALVLEYGKRNLNIAANLARAIKWISKGSSNDNRKLASQFTGGIYDEEIEKYLMLL